MKNIFKNWKTTLTGVGTIIAGVFTGLHGNWSMAVPQIIAGVGLIFAKDGNVTGGTTQQ